MPYREFDDEQGVRWRVWDTYPQTTVSGQVPGFAGGWLTFESMAADPSPEKRRLTPVPARWAGEDEGGLRLLLGSAEGCGRARSGAEAAEQPATAG